MEYPLIKSLLDRYFRGETSLKEEKSLRKYFSEGPVDERLQEFAPLFQWMTHEQGQQLKEEIATNIIDQLKPPTAKVIWFQSRQWITRIAAVLVLMIGMWWAYQSQQQNEQTAAVDWSKYEITDERQALEITRGALLKASQTLNKGANTAAGQMDRMQEIGKFFK